MISLLKCHVHIVDVDGHQDEKVPFHLLSPFKKLNCRADTIAKRLLWRTINHRPNETVSDCIFGEGIRCMVDGIKMTTDPHDAIHESIYRFDLSQYLEEKGTLSRSAFDKVCWDSIGKAMANKSPLFRIWATKHVSGHCGVGARMKKWKFWESDACPCCGAPNKTTQHLPRCMAPLMTTTFESHTAEFHEWLDSVDTHPEILLYFQQALRDKSCPEAMNVDDRNLHTAAQDQALIGWDNLLFGRLVKSWLPSQQAHHRRIKLRRSVDLWAAQVITHLLEISHALWLQQNNILHERDRQGLLLQQGLTLADAITS